MTNAATQSDRDESNQNLDESLTYPVCSPKSKLMLTLFQYTHTKDDKVNKRTVMLRCER